MNAPFRDSPSVSNDAVDWHSGRLWSLWDMLQSYYPIYQLALMLQSLRTTALFFKDSVHKEPPQDEVNRFSALLEAVHHR